jgi:hypothetical protein
LEWPLAREQDGLWDAPVQDLDRGMNLVLTALLSQHLCLFLEQHGMVGFRDEEYDGGQLDAGPDHKRPKGPSPIRKLVDEATDEWS